MQYSFANLQYCQNCPSFRFDLDRHGSEAAQVLLEEAAQQLEQWGQSRPW